MKGRAIRPWDVIVIPDETVRPPKPKFVMCVEPDEGWFYRINTKRWPPAVKLVRETLHPFLDHDSYLECGDPLEIDDFIVEAALRKYGVIGTVHPSLAVEILRLLAAAETLRESDRLKITAALERPR